MFDELAENPPFFFEQPDLDPAAQIAEDYLEDLVRLSISIPPRDVPVEPLIEDVAAYLRVSPKQTRALIDRQYVELFREHMAANATINKVAPEMARAYLHVSDPDEGVQFVYGNVRVQWPAGESAGDFADNDLWLIGTGERLLLVQSGELPSLLWIGDPAIEVAHNQGHLTGSCVITGGTWLAAPPDQTPPAIVVRSLIQHRFQDYFGPLLRYSQSDQHDEVP